MPKSSKETETDNSLHSGDISTCHEWSTLKSERDLKGATSLWEEVRKQRSSCDGYYNNAETPNILELLTIEKEAVTEHCGGGHHLFSSMCLIQVGLLSIDYIF